MLKFTRPNDDNSLFDYVSGICHTSHARTQNTRTHTLTHAYVHEHTHEQERASSSPWFPGKRQAPSTCLNLRDQTMTTPYSTM